MIVEAARRLNADRRSARELKDPEKRFADVRNGAKTEAAEYSDELPLGADYGRSADAIEPRNSALSGHSPKCGAHHPEREQWWPVPITAV